jgi:hypothetical protein
MSDRKYERSITPAPELLSAPATVGFVLEQVANDLRAHTESDTDVHQDMWRAITKGSEKTSKLGTRVDRLYAGLALLGVLIGVFLPVIYFAIKGVIVEELDKRFPDMIAKRYHAQKVETAKADPKPLYIDPHGISWSVVPSAQASNK